MANNDKKGKTIYNNYEDNRENTRVSAKKWRKKKYTIQGNN